MRKEKEFSLDARIRMYKKELKQFETSKGNIKNNQAWNLCQSIIRDLKVIKKREKEFIRLLKEKKK